LGRSSGAVGASTLPHLYSSTQPLRPSGVARGMAGRPHPPAGRGVGNPGFPTPLREGAASHTLPRAGGGGVRCGRPRAGRPAPSRGREAGASRCDRQAPRQYQIASVPVRYRRLSVRPLYYGLPRSCAPWWNEQAFSWTGAALPHPPTGWASGETRFPQTPASGSGPLAGGGVGLRWERQLAADVWPSRGWGVGKPAFPTPRSERLYRFSLMASHWLNSTPPQLYSSPKPCVGAVEPWR